MSSSIDFNKAKMTRNTNPYIYGNAVSVPQQEPQAAPARKAAAPARKKSPVRRDEEALRQERLNNKRIRRANKVNFLYTLGVSAIVVTIFVMCVQYLNIQSAVQGNQNTVTQLQTKLNEITNENNEREVEINTNIDYELIFDTAVNELGMIYPDRNQVITYDSAVSEYVKQYKDIPSAK